MNLNLVFSRKCRWSDHYFSVWCLRNSQKLLTANQFLVSKIFFTIYEYFLLQSAFCSLLIIAKEVNQIRNVVCVVARLVFMFCCALTTGRRKALQHIFLN